MPKTIVFFSTKGGVGKTTISFNTAVALSLQKKKVLLLDLDLGVPLDMVRMCSVKQKKSMVDIVPLLSRVKDTPNILKTTFLASINPYLDFLPGVLSLRTTPHLKASYVEEILNIFKTLDYDYIIIDGGKNLTDVLIKIFDNVNLILLVVAPDILSLYQTKWILDTMQSIGFPLKMIKGVLNRSESKGSVSAVEIKILLSLELLSYIPSEGRIAGLALNRKVPIVLDSPHSRISLALKSLAKDLREREDIYVSRKELSHLRLKKEKTLGEKEKTDIWTSLGLVETVKKVKIEDDDDAIIQLKKRVHKQLIEEMNLKKVSLEMMTKNAEQIKRFKEGAERILTNILAREAEGIISSLEVRRKLIKEVIDEALGFGPLEDLIKDPKVTEIMVNNKDQVYIESAGKIELTNKRFTSDEQVKIVVERILAPLGRRIDESSPYVDARLPDGSRVNAIIPPLSLTGPTLTIRKFAKHKLTIDELVKQHGSLTEGIAKFLQASVVGRKNTLVSGGTGSGKTTFLNILSEFIPSRERIITIEDSAELKLHHRHWIRLESKPPNIEGKGEITIRDLFRNTLRMRPDRIIVGECRGKEILDMLQAMNTGHDGSMSTLHANSTQDVLIRLDSMILMSGVELPLRAIREMISSAVDLIVHTTRLSDGTRKVVQITEITGMREETARVELKDIFVFKQTGLDSEYKVQGYFTATGYIPSFYEEICAKGIPLDKEIFTPTPPPPSSKK